jgi:hypothetical protein
MEWTTYFAKGHLERSLAGIVFDRASLDGIDVALERTNRVQITAQSDAPELEDTGPDLVEFLDVAARVLAHCAAEGSATWSALVVTVRHEAGSIGAFLVADQDPYARSGALVLVTLPSLEVAAANLPSADEAPSGVSEGDLDAFTQANLALGTRVRDALVHAARTEPARTSIAAFCASTRLPIVLDPVGEVDRADFVHVFNT